ncbi:MAG: carboxy-S-adenosyl-L-methionine synthase CmoA [Deltaproteobacteria bacterium]|uniref:carboxy-S-adenosyl-L-methionine synthase CmoA n=1 Tax=Hydrosulfovibrio ferrireducens TaxID=2934181 RepID=UPI001226EBFB|nr:MAG: carboxy-S-adenosyl-L-methionine synthase CmoA [Deltaproteobacteria bacterium]
MAKKDEIFATPHGTVADFSFDAKTASVFDDMLVRSIPFYLEVQRMMAELTLDFAVPGTNVYDLGCSTGTTLIQLDPILPAGVRMVGCDYSEEMLKKAEEKLKGHGMQHDYHFECMDLNNEVRIENASVVIMNLTLQFVRPLNRERLIQSIAKGVNENGCMILIEKVLSRDSLLNRFFIKYYYDFKEASGYSKLEISQKREALENVLIPYRVQENEELVLQNGFSECEIFFKWYNFCGYIIRKVAK